MPIEESIEAYTFKGDDPAAMLLRAAEWLEDNKRTLLDVAYDGEQAQGERRVILYCLAR